MELYAGLLFIFLALTMAAWAVLRRSGQDAYARIALYWSGDMPSPLETEADQSFTERVLAPLFSRLAKRAGTLLPKGWLERIARQIMYAGSPAKLTAERFVMVCAITGLGLPFTYLLLSLASGGFSRATLLFVGLLVAGGFYLPWFWLRMQANRRQTAINDALPDAMDLLTVSVEAGLGLEAALQRVAEKLPGPLSQEIQRMLAEMSLGTRRREALRNLASRTTVAGLHTLVSALIQADQMGITLGSVLRAQADQLRTKRRQIAEEKAMKAPLKILFPLVIFILPSVFVVVLAPAIMTLIRELV